MAQWDECAIKKTLIEESKQEGLQEKSRQVVINLLETNRFSISEIANFAGVSEEFVNEVRQTL